MQHSYLEAILQKNTYHFLERCRNYKNAWLRPLMHIVYIRPYSLNRTTAFYFVTEC